MSKEDFIFFVVGLPGCLHSRAPPDLSLRPDLPAATPPPSAAAAAAGETVPTTLFPSPSAADRARRLHQAAVVSPPPTGCHTASTTEYAKDPGATYPKVGRSLLFL
uniref:Uncharacterized protein n=1 Tax=Leersia perrieri TaxID=77586 RepID=A0A0D9VGS5_9ORYZ